MRRFLLGHEGGRPAVELVEACLAQIGPIPVEANLGFVYATHALTADLPGVLSLLRQRTGIAHWTGTAGMGISATAQEYYETPALAVMVAAFPPTGFRPFCSQTAGIDGFLAEAGDWLAQDPFHFGLLHADSGSAETPALIAQLALHTPGAFFVGGLTSSNGARVQVAGTGVTGGVAGVIFSSEVAVVTSHTQGCAPIGNSHLITACERNIVIELDHRPALDVFREDVGEVIARDLSRVGGYIFAGFPIAGSDTGDYIVRNLVGIDQERKLIAVGEYLSAQSEIMFCRRDGNSARDDMQRMLRDLARRMGAAPRGGVYYSCLGRGRHQFGENSEELKLIRDALGEIPLLGFFANGEIFHNRLYAYTGVLTLFC